MSLLQSNYNLIDGVSYEYSRLLKKVHNLSIWLQSIDIHDT